MLRGLYTAYTGMLNEQYRMDIMSNNLANADTTGFKKEGSTSQAYDEVMAVKIKDLSEKLGGKNYVRIAVRNEKENNIFLDAARRICKID